MGHLTYEQSKKRVIFGFWLLFIVTLIEVGFSLLGKGHILKGVENMRWLVWLTALIIILLSLYKAYFIIYEFMHMKYEVKGMALSVLLPVLLLVWGLIAFLMEGNYWKERRSTRNTELRDGAEDLGFDGSETLLEPELSSYFWG